MSNGTHCRHGIHYGDMCAKCQPIYTEEECRAAINAAVELALEAAPQAQEEPIGAPAPAGSVPVEGRDVSPDGTTIVRGYRTHDGVIHITGQEHIPPPQPPAPASPAGLTREDVLGALESAYVTGFIQGWGPEKASMEIGVMALNEWAKSDKDYAILQRFPPAAPEAGAPGTQTPDEKPIIPGHSNTCILHNAPYCNCGAQTQEGGSQP